MHALLLCSIALATCASQDSPNQFSRSATWPGPAGSCARWTKTPDPVWEGFYMAADPCVVHDEANGRYLLYATGFLPEPDRSVIGVASSADGIAWDWAAPTTPDAPVAVALEGRPGAWDAYVETVHVMRSPDDTRWWMFYTGYVPDPDRFVYPYEIGMAVSDDGIAWTRASDTPVLTLDPAGFDNGAMTSPAVVVHEVEGRPVLHMIYLGWRLDAQGDLIGLRINGATSTDGLVWHRHDRPVLETPIAAAPWIAGVSEPTLMVGDDDLYYLFVTADAEPGASAPGGGLSPTSIAVLKSDHPFGPWQACPSPLVTMTQPWESEEVVAPHVIMEDDRWRMWYHGFTLDDPVTGERFRIGHAELMR